MTRQIPSRAGNPGIVMADLSGRDTAPPSSGVDDPPQPPARSSGTRIHDLDALRAFAMLLIIGLHAINFLLPLPDDFPWPARDAWVDRTPPEQNPYIYFLFILHGFRLHLFFIITGFFTAMLWQRYGGLRQLLVNRLIRIAVPLLASMLTIVPILAWLFAGSDFKAIYWPIAWLGGLFHIWFLWYLLLMIAVFLVLAGLGMQFRHKLWWLAVPIPLVPQYFMEESIFGGDTPVGIIPEAHVFALYLPFFLFGAFFYQRDIAVRRWWGWGLIPALLVIFPVGLLFLEPEFFLGADPVWANFLSTAMQVAYAWIGCFGMMGLFRGLATRERFWVRYLSDSSYWIYLAHLPLVVIGQIMVVNWPINVHLKFGLICVTTGAILLLLYQFCVRYTIIGRTMSGPRTRRRPHPRPAAPMPGVEPRRATRNRGGSHDQPGC